MTKKAGAAENGPAPTQEGMTPVQGDTLVATETLERLVEQQINLGLKNPHDCFAALERQLGTDLLDYARPLPFRIHQRQHAALKARGW